MAPDTSPDQHAESVRSRLLDWANELCPEWAQNIEWYTKEGGRQARAEAQLLREAAALIDGRDDA